MLPGPKEQLPPLPFVPYALPSHRLGWNGLFFVGEAPGKEEVRLGMPFVGRSGQLLNEVMAEASIDRNASAIANVFRYQPPDNKIGHFFSSRRAASLQKIAIDEQWGCLGTLWCKKEYSFEIKELSDTLQQWNPRIIVALGRTPFWALTGHNGLLENTGKIFKCRDLPEIPVLPTFHPSYILRGNWTKRPEWLKHFVFAARYVAQK